MHAARASRHGDRDENLVVLHIGYSQRESQGKEGMTAAVTAYTHGRGGGVTIMPVPPKLPQTIRVGEERARTATHSRTHVARTFNSAAAADDELSMPMLAEV